ncbi:4-diphosphocytidyl-2C-methyl-D-erythritol kinase [Sphingomonas oleivorans]|uniref:4-diphosphocytidyl-2C-methyl-D-erythritol kinase n=1 Tax=Sphingomonas oleivorans TaxID=1735121 RepID=A0A2T5FWG9_9SPHN|nr:nucleotidyltransferase family protein [Sphingomonas oleivorans]PTQ10130.1 4-diphosphocytidyl-2C-methyl-D-erythritol kinase [Sphingomonas oleivorans]
MRAAILLAAGSSRRFGRANKLLAPLAERPLLLHALERARAGAQGRVIVVTGADRARVAAIVRGPGVTIVHAADHRQGISASLRRGIAALRPIEREVTIHLGDMPFVADARRWRLAAGQDALRPIAGGRPGHPVLLRTEVARRARDLAGDKGLGTLLSGLRLGVAKAGPGSLIDIDSRAMLIRARRMRRL